MTRAEKLNDDVRGPALSHKESMTQPMMSGAGGCIRTRFSDGKSRFLPCMESSDAEDRKTPAGANAVMERDDAEYGS